MPSDYEIQFHRSFLGLAMSLKIWNDDYTYQNNRGGPPDRQNKMDSDPVFAYHVRQGPHWPSKPPGDGPDKKYNALLARTDGSFEPLVIITKRGLTGQDFPSVATPWESTNSVMCGGKFNPVVNSMMEVTGHFANVRDSHLLHPKGIHFSTLEEYITNEVPLYLWTYQYYDGSRMADAPIPAGWERFSQFHGGIDVMVLPNGEVIGAHGHPYSANNGHAISVMSPLDFWAPGSRLLAGAIRGLTNRVTAAVVRGFQALRAPTQELAEAAVLRLSAPTTLAGVAVSARGMLPVATVGKRTILMADDMAMFQPYLATTTAEAGFYDIVIHGDPRSFYILQNGAWKAVTAKEVASVVKPLLGPNDKIRLLACESASRGGPAQELANELNRTVWAPSKSVYPVQGVPIKDANGNVVKFTSAKSFVPDGGKFFQFDPAGGSSILSGPGRQVNQHVIRR